MTRTTNTAASAPWLRTLPRSASHVAATRSPPRSSAGRSIPIAAATSLIMIIINWLVPARSGWPAKPPIRRSGRPPVALAVARFTALKWSEIDRH
jgi:hypothetical protein